ncbi:MAG: acyl-CoA dehydrogenase family protein, partial [Steroidobacteraceae bacterium]
MDLSDTVEEAAFRAEVRQWLAANAPAYRWGPGTSGEERLRLGRSWMAAKAKAGYMGITLAKEFGGRGGTPVEDLIFREEEAQAMMGSHDESFGGGLVGMAVPTILAHAQPGWAERLIAPTLQGGILWCQLFSEPGGGSDMAAFRTRAVRSGDEWIVNG